MFSSAFRRAIHSPKLRSLSTQLLKEGSKGVIASKDEILQFDQAFPTIVGALKDSEKFRDLSEVSSRFERSLYYNVPKGKRNRGLAVVASYKILEKPHLLTEENLAKARILGWLVEMLQGFFLVLDDLTDGSETRRGQLCWYKNPDIGWTAINDGILLENSIYLLLKKYFSTHESYVHFMELFHDVTVSTIVGQILDCNILKVNNLTMERYESIAINKTAYYSFYLPVALALYLSNNKNYKAHAAAKAILLKIGTFFQIQDDFLDCFGDPKVTGKIGTDIETAKCTWLAVTAMELASEEQKVLMGENYGKQNEESVNRVKDLYRELNIPKLFKEYEEGSYEQIQSSIQNLPEEIPHELFDKIIATIYRRVS